MTREELIQKAVDAAVEAQIRDDICARSALYGLKQVFDYIPEELVTASLSLAGGCGAKGDALDEEPVEGESFEDVEEPGDTIEIVSLSAAVEEGKVTVAVLPIGIDAFLLDVTNVWDEPLLLRCDLDEGGYYLHSASGDYQNLLITHIDEYYMDVTDGCMQLAPGETKRCGGDCTCMNIHRDIPDETCGYALTRLEDSTLAGLVQLFKEENVSYDVRQAAVWIVTDDADEYDVQTLTVSYTDGSTETMINETEYAEALALVERARQMA